MRVLFNHGLTLDELYTNTPKNIIDRKWAWFMKHYGRTNSYEGSISNPFKYCIGLVLNKMIDDRIRFKLPVNTEAYLDYEIVNEDKFAQHRQYGRFQDIDFVGSDFTGYAIRYYIKSKAYQKSYQLYLGGDLKNKFIENINNGIKYYSIKDITIDYFLEDVYDKFPDLTRKELKNLILHGFRRLHSAMKFGCGITIGTRKFTNCYFYIGSLYSDEKRQVRDYVDKRDRKLRKIQQWLRPEFDGYYYIGLNPAAFNTWLELNKASRKIVKFKHIMLKKIKEELYYRHKEVYVFRIKIKKFKGWLYWADKIDSRNVVYMGKAENLSFKSSDITWKELIKTYETGNS